MSIKPYKTGKPMDELEREYGISNSIKLASNENPLGPSPMAVEAIRKNMDTLHRYPDGGGYYLTAKLAEKLGRRTDEIVLGNGSDDVIGMLTRAFLVPGDEALMTLPSFLMYEIMVRTVGATPVTVPLKDLGVDLDGIKAAVTPRTRMIFLTNPNNPTGTIITQAAFERFLADIPEDIIIVIDEAYIEFAADDRCLDSLKFVGPDYPVVTLRTFSKAYGLAGIRIGYGVMDSEIAGYLHRIRQPFNANSLAQAAAVAALDDEAFLAETIKTVHSGIAFLMDEIGGLGLTCFPTHANFFLIDVGRNADDVFEALLREGVIVRSMSSYGFPEYIRLSVGLPEENRRFVSAMEKVMK